MIPLAKFIIAFIFTALLISACEKSDLKKDVPDCIESKINDIKNEPVRNPPASVWEWKVDGKTYYYITSDCCDQFNYLYDDDCSEVCAPDGGFTGAGDGQCPDFQGQIIKTLVWEDNRE
ncbi:MAG: hypothetical protein AB9834_11670 [Lentimicrobium sp.]